MSTVSYPLDQTGLSTANKVSREEHVLTEVNDATYRIIIPDFAPFYLDNFEIVHKDDLGVERVLVRDLDYVATIPYLSASQAIGKMLYGGATINTKLTNGRLFVTYQTLGGEDNAYVPFVREQLHEMIDNPRVTSWEIISNKPDIYPPLPHDHPFDEIDGSADMIDALNKIPVAIAGGPDPTGDVIRHLFDFNNPHETTKELVGLGNVENLPLATDAEVMAKEPLDKYITLRQAIMLFNALNTPV